MVVLRGVLVYVDNFSSWVSFIDKVKVEPESGQLVQGLSVHLLKLQATEQHPINSIGHVIYHGHQPSLSHLSQLSHHRFCLLNHSLCSSVIPIPSLPIPSSHWHPPEGRPLVCMQGVWACPVTLYQISHFKI